MVVCGLDEDELDDEDRAILAEVSKKGYYHGRPKSVQVEAFAPKKIEASAEEISPGAKVDRTQLDPFQKKWDCFDREDTIQALEKDPTAKNTKEELKPKPKVVVKPSGGIKTPTPNVKVVSAPNVKVVSFDVHTFDIMIVGDGGVGKTTFLERHQTGNFVHSWKPSDSRKTTPLKFRTNCGDLVFNIIDANGSSYDDDGYPPDCPDVDAAIYFFDLSNIEQTFHPCWLQYVSIHGPKPVVVVGNKADLKDKNMGVMPIRKSMGLTYFELSVKTLRNFEKPFLSIARTLTNQPHLDFVGQRAVLPLHTLEPKIFGLHDKLLKKACSTRVGDDTF